jgi:hypothetical protein
MFFLVFGYSILFLHVFSRKCITIQVLSHGWRFQFTTPASFVLRVKMPGPESRALRSFRTPSYSFVRPHVFTAVADLLQHAPHLFVLLFLVMFFLVFCCFVLLRAKGGSFCSPRPGPTGGVSTHAESLQSLPALAPGRPPNSAQVAPSPPPAYWLYA